MKLEDRLRYQAFHDDLTGLPNRALFLDRLEQAVARSSRRPQPLAVHFLDLDGFKHVNDSLGHDAGDQLLVEVGKRLQRCVRGVNTVARLGGDEFTVLLEEAPDHETAAGVVERIAEVLEAPFVVGGREAFVTTSIGIALGSGRGVADALLRDADAAMYRAKTNGKARYEVFDARVEGRALERLDMGTDLRRAIDRGELVLYYQPRIDLATGSAIGVEALVRWRLPRRGLVPPLEFIPLAEETGLILPIGRWVLREACRQASAWWAAFPDVAPVVSVNLSVRQLQQPDLVEEVDRVLRETGLAPHRLALEITESVVMAQAEENIATLHRLKALGVALEIDDFGTGYSGLSALRRFPVAALKIDRSFIDGLGQDAGDTAIVRAVTTLAHSMGLEVVAEGVETAGQLAELRELGCEVAQGYLFAKPMPGEDLQEMLAHGDSRAPRLELAAAKS